MDERIDGIPSDYKPETRFLRAAYAKLMSLPVDDDSAINEVFQLLTAVNNPKGVLRPVEKRTGASPMDPIHCSIRHQEPCPLCAYLR